MKAIRVAECCNQCITQSGYYNEGRLTNHSSAKKVFKLFSYVEWCLWNADDDSRNFQRDLSICEVEVVGSAIYHKTEYRERRNHYAVYSVNSAIDGFDTSRDRFLGFYNGADKPDVVINGNCTNSVTDGWFPIASHQINMTLEPGESKTFIFVLGYLENAPENKWEAKGIVNIEPACQMLD